MPFFRKIENKTGTTGIWKLRETSAELLPHVNLSEPEEATFNSFKNERRKKEFLAVRALLQELTGNQLKIEYKKNGRPYLKDSQKYISISHSSELAVVFISDRNAGVDVENTNRNIAPIAKRFLSKEEMSHTEKSADKQVMQTIYWSAKEAIFKCTSKENIRFNSQILIEPFELEEKGNFRGTLKTEHLTFVFELNYFLIENNVVVYCVEM